MTATDSDIEKIYSILVDADVPLSINDLKNPTEDFVINLMTTVFNHFGIDIRSVDKPTCEQQDVMTLIDDSRIISIINLCTVMKQICNLIFFKDFSIIDVTSPGPKRTRKLGQFLANFMLYTNHKQSELQERIDAIFDKDKELQNLLQKKDEVLERINNEAVKKANKLTAIDKCKADIEKAKQRIEKMKHKTLEVKEKLKTAEREKQAVLKTYTSYKTEAMKLGKVINEAQSEVVSAPEEYKAKLHELKEERKVKDIDREVIEHEFQNKKSLIEHISKALALVQSQHNKFLDMKDKFVQLKKLPAQKENLQKQTEVLRKEIANFENELSILHNKLDSQYETNQIDQLHAEYKDQLSTMQEKHMQLLNERKLLREKLQEEQTRHDTVYQKIRETKNRIKKTEEESVILLKSYQDLYDREIAEEVSVRREICRGETII